MDPFFAELGRTVLERWKRENFSLASFPEIARSALQERPPAGHVELAGLVRDFLLDDEQPFQTDSPFGEPEIVAYTHSRFYIQLLFWMHGTTAIHQHEFSGAFHVMHGSSIHAQYAFEDARPVTPYLRLGNVRVKSIELLETGSTVPITSGPRAIHSLFHLDSPSVTVVVRTQHDPGTGPQFNYLPPHVAIDPHFSDTLTTRRKQLLDVLEQSEDPAYAERVAEMIAELDFERGFSILHHSAPSLQQLDQWEPILKVFETKHGALAKGIAATLAEDARRAVVKELRATTIEPDHRFFLALLMNAPTRGDLLTLVSARFPDGDPMATVLRWSQELMEVSDQGVSILDASFPEALDVDPMDQPEMFISALEHFCRGGKKLPPALREVSASELKELVTVFARSAMSVLAA